MDEEIKRLEELEACMDKMLNPDYVEEHDNVNHPPHYNTGNFECIDVMLETQGRRAVMDFCICNAFKYIYRARNKNAIEDVRKAIWYLHKFDELYRQFEGEEKYL